MSIALSALVRPSRIQRFVWGGCGVALCAAALAVGLTAPECFRWQHGVALAQAFAGSVVLRAAAVRPKTHRIDISGTGDLRVTVQQGVDGRDDGTAGDGKTVLLPGSVIWPMLMLVRHAAPAQGPANGPVSGSFPGPFSGPRVLPVWRDSADADTWRALAVAMAVVGRRAGADEGCENTTNSMQRTNS